MHMYLFMTKLLIARRKHTLGHGTLIIQLSDQLKIKDTSQLTNDIFMGHGNAETGLKKVKEILKIS